MGALITFIIFVFICMLIQPVGTCVLLVIALVITLLVSRAISTRDEKIVSAEVISRTQVMTEKYQHSGFSIGMRGNPRMYWRVKQVPSHTRVEVAVVYEDGKHRQLTLTEGGLRYNRIMSICEKRKAVSTKTVPQIEESPKTSTPEVDYIDVKTNQLVAGVYVIGEAIPEGNYDLKWVWGSGSVHKYVDNTTTLGASNLFQWVGNTHDYEQRVLVNVVCKSGEYLHVCGNLVVEIRKSKPVVLNL